MTTSTPSTAPDRRTFLALGAVAFGAGLVSLPGAAGARGTSAYLTSRTRYKISHDVYLPTARRLTTVPWDVSVFADPVSLTLQTDGRVLVNTTGLYRLSLSLDWAAQHGVDVDLRMYGLRRVPVGGSDYSHDDLLGSVDVPGSDPPRMARYQGDWTPGIVPLGGMVTVDVKVTPANTVNPGDLAIASHSQVRDPMLGPTAVAALIIQAKVVAKDVVRVTFYNPMVAAGINIPAGTLNVVAMTSVLTRGESADAWQVLNTPTVELKAGEFVYATMKSNVANDYIQATDMSFLQIERVE
jgi:hypothetical protein